MVGIRVLLISALAILLVWFLRSRNAASVRALKKVFLVALIAFAMVAVLNPDVTDSLAALLGVGRGADLLLYSVTVAFLFFAMNSYLKNLEMEQRIVVLTREIGLLKQKIEEH